MFDLLFSYYRGLFFTSPLLLLAMFGFLLVTFERSQRPEMFLCASVFVAYLLLNSAFNHWHAGWTFGPRYLIPSLPFLCLPLAVIFKRMPRLASALAIVSVAALMFFIKAVDPQVPSAGRNPLYDHVLTVTQGETLVMNGLPLKGPVSANPIGAFETWDHPAKAISSVPRRWHSLTSASSCGREVVGAF